MLSDCTVTLEMKRASGREKEEGDRVSVGWWRLNGLTNLTCWELVYKDGPWTARFSFMPCLAKVSAEAFSGRTQAGPSTLFAFVKHLLLLKSENPYSES